MRWICPHGFDYGGHIMQGGESVNDVFTGKSPTTLSVTSSYTCDVLLHV
jgi:hypothetical protein